jgi:hypothetical protein
MIKNSYILRKFEKEETAKTDLSFKDALKIFEAMWQEALALGAVKNSDWLNDVEKELRIARIINGIQPNV